MPIMRTANRTHRYALSCSARVAGGWPVSLFRLTILGSNVAVQTRSVLTCPVCGTSSEEEMPEDACVYFYECRGCGKRLKPAKGDFWFFCSFGTVKGPPVQVSAACCGPGRQ